MNICPPLAGALGSLSIYRGSSRIRTVRGRSPIRKIAQTIRINAAPALSTQKPFILAVAHNNIYSLIGTVIYRQEPVMRVRAVKRSAGIKMSQMSQSKGLDDRCCYCGIALYKHEISACCNGTYIDYDAHDFGEVEILFCSECWTRIKKNMDEEQSEAIMRRLELDNTKKYSNKKQLSFDHAEDEFLNENPFGYKAPDETNGGI